MFLSWWKKKVNVSLVGIDLGSQSIKLLKLSVDSPSIVENFLISPLPEEATNKGVITDFNVVGNILKNLFLSAEIKSNQVAFAIPRSLVIFKTITIDARLTEEEIETRVWMEADKHFPDLVGNIYIDFMFSDEEKIDGTQKKITLVACRKDLIKPYLEICKIADLIPKVVDVSSYALERTLNVLVKEKKLETKTSALLNLDLGLSTLIVKSQNTLLYSNDQSLDGSRLMEQVKSYLKNPIVSNSDGNKLTDEKYAAILKETLSAHLRHSMHFFYSNRSDIHIDQLFLSGDCADIPNLCDFIQKEVGIPTVLANPFETMQFSEQVDKTLLQQNAAALAICYGLALTQFDSEKGNRV